MVAWSDRKGAEFFMTGDNKYLVKVISGREFEMFVNSAHTYFESSFSPRFTHRYMAKCLFHGLPSLLCKVLGIYQTVVTDMSGKKTITHYVVGVGDGD